LVKGIGMGAGDEAAAYHGDVQLSFSLRHMG